jgi:hypothetical protein
LTIGLGSAIGGAAAGSGGKKGSNAASQAANQQFQLQNQLFNTGMTAWQPAANYFQTLLSGNPTAVAQAVGPSRDLIQGQAQSTGQQLAQTLPQGGEANLAQAQNQLQASNNIARLYAGVQPSAAQALGQLAATPLGLSAPNVGSGLKYNTHTQDTIGQNKQGIGTGIGTLAAQAPQAKQNKNTASPNFSPGTSAGFGIPSIAPAAPSISSSTNPIAGILATLIGSPSAAPSGPG